MSVIYKYKLVLSQNRIYIPKDAKILCVRLQKNEPHIWAEVDNTKQNVARYFTVIPTGCEFDSSNLTYIGTFETSDGFVGHVFES